MKATIRFILILALCLCTAEWINIEEILGKQDVEITIEKGAEESKEGLEKTFASLAYIPDHHFELKSPISISIALIDFDQHRIPGNFPPLYIAYCQMKTDC